MAIEGSAPEAVSVDSSWRSLIRRDLRAKAQLLYGAESFSCLVRALASDGASAVLLLRFSQFLNRWHLAPVAWLVMKANKVLNGVTIGMGATIGPGFAIQHSVGVVINGRAVIGPDCVLEGGVVIGAVSRKSPRIDAGVYVGSGAKIIGGIRVGAGSKIGANAVVIRDVPADATVVGVPARVV